MDIVFWIIMGVFVLIALALAFFILSFLRPPRKFDKPEDKNIKDYYDNWDK
jgi:hypothetical protein